MDLEERFLEKVKIPDDPNDVESCWEWLGNKHRQGYGFFKVGEKNQLAHRVGYVLFNEGLLESGVKLLHKCDNTSCVCPYHLREGSQGDNVIDMVAKGRHRGTSKLTDDQVRAIRKDPRNQLTIEADMGLARGTVSRIKSRQRYSRVSD